MENISLWLLLLKQELHINEEDNKREAKGNEKWVIMVQSVKSLDGQDMTASLRVKM